MTTKEQERKALAQIKKIVEGLGKDSYIATAFEGAFEDAEINIRDDAAYSMKSRWDSAKLEAQTAKDQLEHLRGVRKHLEGRLESSEQETKKAHTDAQDAWMKVRELEKKVEELTKACADQHDLTQKYVVKAGALEQEAQEAVATATAEAQQTIDRQTDEILHLKAKLYDLMTK